MKNKIFLLIIVFILILMIYPTYAQAEQGKDLINGTNGITSSLRKICEEYQIDENGYGTYFSVNGKACNHTPKSNCDCSTIWENETVCSIVVTQRF